MERHFDEDLERYNTNLVRIAALAETAIEKAVKALENRDKELAKNVVEGDKEVDELQNILEEQAIDLLALHQPMAVDLRLITTGMYIHVALERVADLAVNIAQKVLQIADQPHLKPLIDIPKLSKVARKMVKNAIDSFVKKDKDLAKEVIMADGQADSLRNAIVKELVNDYMVKNGKTAPRAIPLLLVARDLERICDHAASIAEDIIYMIDAKIVKHHPELLEEK